jgi:hypothetical protein
MVPGRSCGCEGARLGHRAALAQSEKDQGRLRASTAMQKEQRRFHKERRTLERHYPRERDHRPVELNQREGETRDGEGRPPAPQHPREARQGQPWGEGGLYLARDPHR